MNGRKCDFAHLKAQLRREWLAKNDSEWEKPLPPVVPVSEEEAKLCRQRKEERLAKSDRFSKAAYGEDNYTPILGQKKKNEDRSRSPRNNQSTSTSSVFNTSVRQALSNAWDEVPVAPVISVFDHAGMAPGATCVFKV